MKKCEYISEKNVYKSLSFSYNLEFSSNTIFETILLYFIYLYCILCIFLDLVELEEENVKNNCRVFAQKSTRTLKSRLAI